MPLDPDAVGWESKPRETSWRSEDCLLYALGVGAGPADLVRQRAQDLNEFLNLRFAVLDICPA